MSADDTKVEQLQNREQENMSSITQDAPKEARPAVPAFSYAQAAKGKVPSIPTTPPVSMAKSDTSDTSAKKEVNVEVRTISPGSRYDLGKQTTSEGGKPKGSELKAAGEPGPIGEAIGNGNGALKEPASTVESTAITPASDTTSTSPNPKSGPALVSPMPKDEDNAPMVNGLAESTSDKHSQSSQNGKKNGEKVNTAKDGSEKSSEAPWDEDKPETASLKEAPPPPVNFWAQRMAQPTKAKPQQSAPMQMPKPASLPNGVSIAGESVKTTESAGEPRKLENKKKSKASTEDRPTMKEGSKSVEGKIKGGEGRDFEFVYMRHVLILAGNNKTNTSAMAPPPPPGDAISWPTPDSAIEEKKKPQSRNEKDDKERIPAAKPHGKNQWQTVPFVPTVNFNTPMPTSRTRGGRGTGGASRDSGARSRNGNSVDKSTTTGASPTNQSSVGTNERGKPPLGSSPATQSTQRPKRALSAGPVSVKEQRKPGDVPAADKRRESDISSAKAQQGKATGSNEPRRQSATAVNEGQGNLGSSGRAPREAVNVPKKSQVADDAKYVQDNTAAAHVPRNNSDVERRNDVSARPADLGKDLQSNQTTRERGDGRQERGGRGGYRGRGGPNFNAYNAHLSSGHAFPVVSPQYQPPTGGLPSRSFSNHERLASQPQPSFYPPTPQHNRAYRSNSRSQSIQHSYGRFSHQSHTGPPHLANLQTDLANNYAYSFDPQSGPMSALPFNPYMVGPSLFGMVGVQMEYYFSVDNLCKDTYLRKNMNSQGFVPLELVAGFNRIKQLTSDINMVRDVCFASAVIETRVAEDESIWLRKGTDWQQWVMDMESRVPQARSDGPSFPAPPPFQTYGVSQTFNEGHEMSPKSRTANVPPDNMQYQSLDGATAPVAQTVTIPAQHQNGMSPSNQAPLSAAVSEFSPSVRSTTGRVFSSPDPQAQGTSTISDEEMDKLVITFRAKPADATAPVLPPFHSASSRTFSNGSIDGHTISTELAKFAEHQPRPTLNGDTPER